MASSKSAQDLGAVRCSLSGSITCGSYQTCELRYTAGFAGIDDTGSIKIVMRYATDAGLPQFDDPAAPHYTTAVASNGARLRMRYDVKDNRRPWGRTIQVKVLQGYLRRGDTITVTIGDRAGGSPGWRMQTFAEDTFELKVLVDRYATYVYEELRRSPTFRVAAGEPVRLVAVAPSSVAAGKSFVVRYRIEDRWGNPVGKPRRERFVAATAPAAQRFVVRDQETGLSGESNPVDVSPAAGKRYWADIHGQSEETIGTNSIDAYFRFARDLAFIDICGHQGNDFQITDDFWAKINETTRRFDKPGKFVALPGWEWSGNTGLGGDRNVFFLKEGGPISRSSRALVDNCESKDDCSDDVESLFKTLSKCGRDVMVVPHVGGRYADLDRHDAALEPVVEVHSAWGTFEWMLEDAFRNGYKIGIVANSDGHKGRPGASYPGASTFGSLGGLTCVLSEGLDRQSVWDAYQDRRVYATTGNRLLLDVSTNRGDPMGAIVPLRAGEAPKFRVRVAATAAIERIEIRNAMRVLKTVRTYTAADLTSRLKVLWQGAEVRGRGRQVTWDGKLQLSGASVRDWQPINFWNSEKPCRQVGRRELQWEAITTGGVCGVIVELARSGGQLQVSTAQKSFSAEIDKLGVRGRSYGVGGVGKRISAYRLPPAGGPREIEFTWKPAAKHLHSGSNPIYVCVVQEDGHMAWSSPIYLEI